MLNHAAERCTEQRMVVVKTRSKIELKGKEMTSQNGQAPSSDSVSPMTSVTESNYNSINYHMKSGRNLAVIRRRAQRLRQRDMEIRKRLEKVNKKAKSIDDDSPTKQGLMSNFETGSTQIIPSCTVVVSSDESVVASTRRTDLKSQHLTESMRIDYQLNDSISDKVSSQPNAGIEENDSQSNLNVTNCTVSIEDIFYVTSHLETGSEVYRKLLNLKTECDGVSADDDTETGYGRSRRTKELTTPAEHKIEMNVSSPKEKENMELTSSVKRIKIEPAGKSSAVKLKAFVGERYCLDKAKSLSKSNRISNEEVIHTPKRQKRNIQAMSFYLADMAAPCSLGISPKRIQHHKYFTSKKTRMVSTLTSTFTGSMNFSKMKMRKTILNILRTDRRTCYSEVC